MVSLGTQPANRKSGFGHSSPTGARAQDLSRQPARPDLWGARVSNDPGLPDPEVPPSKLAISEFPKGRKYLISLSFRGKASVRPAQVGGFDVNIVIHGSTAVRGRGDLVAYRWALWKLTAPWTHRTRPPHLGKRCAFSTSSTGPFPSNHSRKTPKGPKIALGNPDRPSKLTTLAAGSGRLVGGHLRRRGPPRVAGAERRRYGKWLTWWIPGLSCSSGRRWR